MAQVSALLRRAQALWDEWCDDQTRYTDFFVQFREVHRTDEGIRPTGRVSELYGWRWDRDKVNHDGTIGGWVDADELIDPDIKWLDCSPAQFDIVTDDTTDHLLVIGSRGSSKTETGVRWEAKQIATAPRKNLSIMVAKRKKARRLVEKKLLPLLPDAWQGSYRKSQDEIVLSFKHGGMVDCLSAKVADDARGDDQVGALIDESQLCPAEARENLVLSGRDNSGRHIQTLETATMLAGEFEDYVEECRNDPTYRVIELSLTDNIFLDTVFDPVTGCNLPKMAIWARQHMDRARYEQEIGVWDADAKRFRPKAAQDTGLVYHQFRKKRHVEVYDPKTAEMVIRKLYDSAHPRVGRDITEKQALRKFRKRYPVLGGIDFNPPLAGVMCRFFSTPPGIPDLIWAIDEQGEADINPTALAKSIKVAGHFPAGVIPDAAGRFSDGDKSSVQLVRQLGFDVRGPAKNPPDRDRINSVNAKLLNAADHITLLIDPKCKRLIKALQAQRLGANGSERVMEQGEDSFARALGYLVTYYCPAKMIREAA